MAKRKIHNQGSFITSEPTVHDITSGKAHPWTSISGGVATDASFSSKEERSTRYYLKPISTEEAKKSLRFNREDDSSAYTYDRHPAIKKAGYPVREIMRVHCENSVKVFARMMGVSTMSIYNWLAGSKPNEENLSFMVARFGVRRAYLETGEGQMYE